MVFFIPKKADNIIGTSGFFLLLFFFFYGTIDENFFGLSGVKSYQT